MTKGKPLDLEYVDILRIVQDSTIGDYRKAGEIEKYIKQRIKLAVQGLLEELKLECKPYDFLEVRNKKLSYEQIKQLIKKYFPDEVKRK